MRVTNVSQGSLYLSYVPTTIEVGQTVTIDDSFQSHPQFAALVNADPPLVKITNVGSTNSPVDTLTRSQVDAIRGGKNLSGTNPVISKIDLTTGIEEHSKDASAHHSNANDPDTNEKEAMRSSTNASGVNPFSTVTDRDSTVSGAIAQHLVDADHSPPSFTQNEIDGIQAATNLNATNAAVTISYLSADTASKIGTHASNATAHHNNVNDPTLDEKAGLLGVTGADPVVKNSDLITHTANFTAHHSNANDPSVDEKAGLSAASPAATGINPVVTEANSGLMTTDQSAAMANASPVLSAANPVVSENFPGVSVVNHLTVDQREGLENALPLPTGLNPVVTEGNSNLLTASQHSGIIGAASPLTASNPIVVDDDGRILTADKMSGLANINSLNLAQGAAELATHTAIATAHHSNANDPTIDEKAGLSGVTGADPVIKNSDLTTHTGVATAHHNNVSDPTIDEKAAMAGTSGTPPSLTNKFVDASDSRLTDARTPTPHALSHTDATDDIQSATSLQKGLMTSAQVGTLTDLGANTSDCRLERVSTTQLDLVGAASKSIYINGESVPLTINLSLLTTDNLIDAAGADALVAMSASTLFFIYASNSSATFSPSDIRASTTAPTYHSGSKKMVLGTSGNALNWAFVGWAYTDLSTLFVDEMSVESEYNSENTSVTMQGASIVNASIDATWEEVTGVKKTVLLLPGQILEVSASMPVEHTSTGIAIALGVYDGTTDSEMVEIDSSAVSSRQALPGAVVYKNNTSSETHKEYSIRHRYGTALGSTTTATHGRAVWVRHPK